MFFSRGGQHDALRAQARAAKAYKQFRNSPADRLVMWEALAGLLEEHDLVQALHFIWVAHSEDGSRPDNLIAMVADAWLPRLRAPEPFADVVRGAVSPREELIIAVGQQNNRLSATLRDLYTTEFRNQTIIAHWKGSLTEPAYLVGLTWGTLVYIAWNNVKQPAGLSRVPHKLGRLLLEASSSILHWWSWVVPLVIIVISIALKWSMQNLLNSSRVRLDYRLPWVILKWRAGVDFISCVTTLVTAGMTSSAALLAMRRTAEPYLGWQIEAIEPFTRNHPLGWSLRASKRLFPDAGLNAVLDHAGHLPPEMFTAVLRNEAQKYTEDVIKRIEKTRSTIYTWALIIFGVLQLLTFVLSSTGILS